MPTPSSMSRLRLSARGRHRRQPGARADSGIRRPPDIVPCSRVRKPTNGRPMSQNKQARPALEADSRERSAGMLPARKRAWRPCGNRARLRGWSTPPFATGSRLRASPFRGRRSSVWPEPSFPPGWARSRRGLPSWAPRSRKFSGRWRRSPAPAAGSSCGAGCIPPIWRRCEPCRSASPTSPFRSPISRSSASSKSPATGCSRPSAGSFGRLSTWAWRSPSAARIPRAPISISFSGSRRPRRQPAPRVTDSPTPSASSIPSRPSARCAGSAVRSTSSSKSTHTTI